MSSKNISSKMTNKIFNMFPVAGGSIGATSPMYIHTMSWSGVGELALQAAVLAFVGAIIGWGVKFTLDKIFKKK